uniref:hypothetical protein n=1 Tax=Sandaracinus sp. TaxID=2024858 RepID=UPI0019D44074|nr:hypothetical protein [Sandaracinus sp.]
MRPESLSGLDFSEAEYLVAPTERDSDLAHAIAVEVGDRRRSADSLGTGGDLRDQPAAERRHPELSRHRRDDLRRARHIAAQFGKVSELRDRDLTGGCNGPEPRLVLKGPRAGIELPHTISGHRLDPAVGVVVTDGHRRAVAPHVRPARQRRQAHAVRSPDRTFEEHFRKASSSRS